MSRLLRAGISIALIAVLFFVVDLRDLLRSIAGFHPISGLIALALVSTQNATTAARWGVMLKAFGSRIGGLPVLKIQYAALFAQLFLPPAVGGAAVRTGMAYRAGVPFGVSVNSVVFDRLVAMTGLILLGVLFMPFAAISFADVQGIWRLWGITAMVMAALVLTTWAALRWRPARWWWEAFNRTPLRHFLASLETAAANLRRPGTAASALAYSIGGQLLAIAAVFTLATGANLPVRFIDCLLVMPPVMFVSALPISVAGWGVREGAMVLAFGMLGVDREPALALSIQAALVGYVAATPGIVVWLLELNCGNLRRKIDTPDRR